MLGHSFLLGNATCVPQIAFADVKSDPLLDISPRAPRWNFPSRHKNFGETWQQEPHTDALPFTFSTINAEHTSGKKPKARGFFFLTVIPRILTETFCPSVY